MASNQTITKDGSWVNGITPYGQLNTIYIQAMSVWIGGATNVDTKFNVAGTLNINIAKDASVSTGLWATSRDGAEISSTGIINIKGTGTRAVVDGAAGALQSPKNIFNLAGNTVNNGIINISDCSMFNYINTSSISGNGTINLTNVTIPTDGLGAPYCYYNNGFCVISNQTINMVNSQISIGSNTKGSISNVTINCSGGGNYIAINAGIASNVSGLKIRGFGSGDILDLGSVGQADSYSYNEKTGILTISVSYNNTTVSIPVDIGLGYKSSSFTTVTTYQGVLSWFGDKGIQYTGPAPCYLGGTLIETANGYVAVETIMEGDHVVAYDNGRRVLRRVIWSGRTSVEPEQSYVVVREGALGAGVPFSDLSITDEHCLYFDGSFVPVRMLVNGHSIFYEKHAEAYDVYHIELASHAVIYANGALSESFLDTGHVAFAGRESLNLQWGQDSAAPLCTDRSFVEPLYRQIVSRVPGLDMSTDIPADGTETEIALLVNGERQLKPKRRNGQTVIFSINEPIYSLSILSETISPSVKIGPFVDDRRMLGALVGEVNMFTPEGMIRYNEHLDKPALTGWYDRESDLYRWTGAEAELTGLQSGFDSNILAVVLHS